MRRVIVALAVLFAFIISMVGMATPSTANAAPKKGIDAVAVEYKGKSYLRVDSRRSPANLDTPTKYSKIVFEGKTVKGKKWTLTRGFHANQRNVYQVAGSKLAGWIEWRVVDTRNPKVFIDGGRIDARFPEQESVKPLAKSGNYYVGKDGKKHLLTYCEKVTKGKYEGRTYCTVEIYRQFKVAGKNGKTELKWKRVPYAAGFAK